MKNVLEVKNISYSVGENKILKDISFKCQSGEIIGIIGPNGSGKTTLLKSINGINSISSGDISFNNKSLKEYSEKELARDISFMNQNTNIEFDFPCKDKIVILVIHNLRTAIKYCSRLILLSNGSIVKDGSIEEVITEENLNNVFGIKTKVYYNEISKSLDFYII